MANETKIPKMLSDSNPIKETDRCKFNNDMELSICNTMKTKTVVATTTPQLDFDDILPYAGEYGLYQVLLSISTMPFYFYGVFVYFTQIFITEVSSQHWCWVPELENLTAIERRNLAIPLDENSRYGYDQCNSYVANWSHVLTSGPNAGLNANWKTLPCQHGWEFNASEFPYSTISSEMGWVCDKDSNQANAQSIFFFGSVCGGFVIGWLADRFGRVPAIIISNLIGCFGGIVSIFATNFAEFAAIRFFMGMSYDNCMTMIYLLVLEYIAPKYRTVISNLTFALFFTTASVALPWIALACGHWKTLSIATSVPLALAVFTPFVVLESPRWLLSKGRVEEAVKKLLTIGRINKKEIPPKLIEQFKEESLKSHNGHQKNILEAMRIPLIRKVIALICIEFMCCALVTDALVRSLGQLEFDFFISFSVVSFTELPSLLVVAFMMDWSGRRWLVHITMSGACVFTLLTAFVGGGLPSVVCAVIARFAVNISYNAAMQWGAEMLPTPVRASGLSTVHVSAYVATMMSSYIVYLKSFVPWLPLVVISCVAGVGAVVALGLPETANKDLPQTFEDAEDLARNSKFWEMPCLMKKDKELGDKVTDINAEP